MVTITLSGNPVRFTIGMSPNETRPTARTRPAPFCCSLRPSACRSQKTETLSSTGEAAEPLVYIVVTM